MIAYSPIYAHPLPKNHRFPMSKYDLVPMQLKLEGIVDEADFFEPLTLDLKHTLGIHTKEWLEKLLQGKLSKQEERRTGFPYTPELINRELHIMEGTRLAAQYALKNGLAFNIAGGTHHAYSNFGSGFCLLNDQAIAAQYLLSETSVKQILIIDLDVHQGDGTAEIFSENNSVFTFSMHGKHNFPLIKQQSDLDIPLENETRGDEYLQILHSNLQLLKDKVKPDFLFYQSGVDVLETDKLGKLSLTIEECRLRDRLVFEFAQQTGLPITLSMGGGYSPEIKHIVDAHANTFKEGIGLLVP